MTTPDTSSELRNRIFHKINHFGEDAYRTYHSEFYEGYEESVTDEIMELIAAERNRWDAASRKAELVILHEFKLQQQIYSGLLEDYIMERMAALTTVAETGQSDTERR